MAGFLPIGTALTGFMGGYQQAQAQAQAQQLNQLRALAVQSELQQKQREYQAQQLLGGLDLSSLANLSGSAGGAGYSAASPSAVQPALGSSLTDYGTGSDTAAPTTTQPQPGSASPSYAQPPAGSGYSSGLPSNTLDLIERDESGGQNVLQSAYSGTGINPSTGTHTLPSTASGYYQITDSTWRATAPAAGVDIAQYPTAMSAPKDVQRQVAQKLLDTQGVQPWAPYNPKLRADLASAGSGDAAGGSAAGIPAPAKAAATNVAQNTARAFPSVIGAGVGTLPLAQLARAIDKANPGVDPAVKFLALAEYQKMMAPTDRLQFQMLLAQNRDEMQLALKNMTIQNQRDLLAARNAASAGTKGWTIQMVDGKPVRINSVTGEVQPVEVSGQMTHIPSAPVGGPVDQKSVDATASMIANYNMPPLTGWSQRTPWGQQVIAKIKELNPDYDATKYTGKQSGARTMGTRSSNLAMATDVAEEQIPLVKATSERIDRTEFPTINAMVIAAQKGTGNEDVVRFLEQVNTLKYVYARALNPTGVARVQDLDRFDNIINQAWSKGQVNAALDQIQQSLAAERRGVNRAMGGDAGAGSKRANGAAGAAAPPIPAVGTVQDGYRYNGGDPADQNSWEPVTPGQ